MPCDNSDVNSITDYENVLSEISSWCWLHNAETFVLMEVWILIFEGHILGTLDYQFVENKQLYLA